MVTQMRIVQMIFIVKKHVNLTSLHIEVCFLNLQTCFINLHLLIIGFVYFNFLVNAFAGIEFCETNERIIPCARFGSKCAIQKARPAGVCEGTPDQVGSWPC